VDLHVELRNVSKHFGAVRALDGVSLQVRKNSIHALVGENGAGKSTLVKIVAGALTPDSGVLLVSGAEVSLGSPRHALRCGIAAVPQEASLVPRFSVYENVFLGVEAGRWGFLRRRHVRRRYEDLSKSAGFALAPDQICAGMRTADQQKVEILRALCRNAELLVLDEPTAALGAQQRLQLHHIVRSLAASGKTVILVSHVLSEVLELADTVTVMRDGRVIRTSSASSETEHSLIQAMLGRSIAATFPAKAPPARDAPLVLSVRGLSGSGVIDASLDVRAGEIVGLAGLVGAGRTELARATFAADPTSAGQVVINGKPRAGRSPRRSMASGLAMLPESRKDDGLIFTRSVIENVSVASLPHFSRFGFVDRRAERAAAEDALRRCTVIGRPTGRVGNLSGGNQQKALFARMLMSAPKVVIADEPTRGVDVGARRAIYELLVDFAAQGGGVLLISSEVEEILGLAHRVLVMRRGRLVRELEGDGITESAILTAAFEHEQGRTAAPA
jgi:simple sugar transport system ATP-binding protein/ribose transport system ATP-binding protein